MLKAIVIILIIGIASFLGVVAMQPSDFRVTRGAIIGAPVSAVFSQVNDFHKWESWSPWAKRDPQMKQAYEGAPTGVGAVSAWSGNSEVGKGRMTITESRADESIRIKLEFLEPFNVTNTAEFAFETEGTQTKVTWSMSGTNNFMAKAVGLFMNMDKMIGGDFEQGLVNLKALTEAAAP
ncbi:MAG: SRPBCC family protein, partial [Burkholderiales bacterium]